MKEKTKKVILLIVICTFTLIALFVALKLSENRRYELLKKSVVSGYLTEIKYEEISTHVIEEPNVIIYVSNSSDEKSINFENNFKKVIKDYNLENEIIYININDVNIVDPIYQNAPQLIFYKDGAVNEIVDCTTLKTSKGIVQFLEERSVISD